MGASSGRIDISRHGLGSEFSYSREFLERLARILVRSGHSPSQLALEFRNICRALKEPHRSWDPRQLAYLSDLPHVVALWHADPQYLDSRGNPSPLPLRGRGPSLSALIDRVLPGENPVAVLKSLIRVQGVRKLKDRYVPSGRSFTYLRASGRVHGLTALLGMLRTVESNVTTGRPQMLERRAFNPSFPVSQLPGFHRRLKTMAEEVLWSLDSDMRRRETKDLHGPRTRLGVGIFAFEEPIHRSRTRQQVRGPARGRGRARPARRGR